MDQALAAVRCGDKLVVPKLDRLARSVPDVRQIADALLARFAEFAGDLIRLRTREGMAIARAKGKLQGKLAKLSDKQYKELCRMHETGQWYTDRSYCDGGIHQYKGTIVGTQTDNAHDCHMSRHCLHYDMG